MNLLFTSVGRRTYLIKYFRKALGKEGKIFAANSSALSPAFLEADESVVTPTIYDKEYIPFLLKYCKKNSITAIISLFDIDVPVLSNHKKDFEKIGTRVLVSNSKFVEICNDKLKTYNFLMENNFNAPLTLCSLERAKNYIKEGKIKYPLIVKPRWGMGSIGGFKADNEQELDVFYAKTKKEVEKTYLKYESQQDISECVIIQEMIDGQEYGLDVMNDLEGNYQNTCIKRKIAMRSGETDCSVTVDDEEIREIGERIAKKSNHIGNLDMDIFKTKAGKCYVLEMNARFGGGFPFSYLAGVDMPKAIIMWLKGEEVDRKILTPNIGVLGQKDIELVRLPVELLKD